MSDQYPVSTAPPQGPPPAPPGPYAPPGQPVPPRKRNTALIVAIVVGVLLLCCCIGSVGAGLILYRTQGSVSTGSGEGTDADGQGETAQADAPARMQEWLDWAPDSPAMLEAAPSSLDDYVAEGMSIIAPQFEAQDAVWLAGEYDAAKDWYYADAVYVRATHPASSQVSAGVEMWIQSDLMVDEEVSFESAEGDMVTTIDSGQRELLYDPQWGPAGFDLADDDEIALWQQIGKDWPGAVVTYGESQGSRFTVSITTWEAYAIAGDYPIVSLTYERYGDGWSLVDWEYQYPEDSDQSTT